MNGSHPDIDALKARLKATWMAGDFGKIAEHARAGVEEFVDRLRIAPGLRVLDVACGSGNASIPAARAGASVTGVDIATNLLEQARERAHAEGLPARFEEGDAEALPFDDESFDVIVSTFGAMFAPRPERVASELVRVCRPGGRIAMANWTPSGFSGKMFKANAAHVPPPPGMLPPVLWGDEATVRERLRAGIETLDLTRRPILFTFPFDAAAVVEFFRAYFGPTQRAFESLDAAGQAALRADLERLWVENNSATDGTTEVVSEYLEVVATRG